MARDSARGNVLFTDEELNEIAGVKKGEDFVEVTCGCTSPRYGDAVGRLRVFASGKLEVACECTPGCREDKLTPAAFEKHTGRESQRRWKYYVWVIVKGKKIPLLKTALLKYHEKMHGGSSHRGNKGRPFHRDEFVRCSRCNRERRFHLQTKVECRTYHDAVLDANWKCSDLPADELPIVVVRRPVHCHSSQPSLLFNAIIPAFFAVVILAQELARALKLRFAIEVMTSSLLFVVVRPPSSDAIILAV